MSVESGTMQATSQEHLQIQRATQRAERTVKIYRVLLWIVLLVGTIVFLTPLWVMIVMALKTPHEVAATDIWSWPQKPTTENFSIVLNSPNAPFLDFFKNTFVITVLSTAGCLVSASLVAYPFARLRFRGRDRLFILLLSTMMLPGIVTQIPSYIIFTHLHWVDTILPLVVPAWFGGGAFNIFLLRQFFMGIPRELDEAAILDGATHATIFWRVIMPNSGAALATVGIFAFVYNWKDFMGPLIYLNSPEKQTLEQGLRTFQSLQQEKWELIMAGSVLVMIPLLVIFLLGQRYFVKGIVMSGIK
ncbi:MAG TPA: carbohydrate ABC transporter permease [Fimbriimonas sp.]|nr:carbohydrate ABC transporter permease [Fimbriimonas sp.]